jgi:hypothetical protein
MTAISASPAATMPVAPTPRGVALALTFYAEPRKEIGGKPNTAGAPGHGDGFGVQQELFDGLDGAHVGLRGAGTHGHAEGYSRKIHVRSGGDPVRGDQLI